MVDIKFDPFRRAQGGSVPSTRSVSPRSVSSRADDRRDTLRAISAGLGLGAEISKLFAPGQLLEYQKALSSEVKQARADFADSLLSFGKTPFDEPAILPDPEEFVQQRFSSIQETLDEYPTRHVNKTTLSELLINSRNRMLVDFVGQTEQAFISRITAENQYRVNNSAEQFMKADSAEEILANLRPSIEAVDVLRQTSIDGGIDREDAERVFSSSVDEIAFNVVEYALDPAKYGKQGPSIVRRALAFLDDNYPGALTSQTRRRINYSIENYEESLKDPAVQYESTIAVIQKATDLLEERFEQRNASPKSILPFLTTDLSKIEQEDAIIISQNIIDIHERHNILRDVYEGNMTIAAAEKAMGNIQQNFFDRNKPPDWFRISGSFNRFREIFNSELKNVKQMINEDPFRLASTGLLYRGMSPPAEDASPEDRESFIKAVIAAQEKIFTANPKEDANGEVISNELRLRIRTDEYIKSSVDSIIRFINIGNTADAFRILQEYFAPESESSVGKANMNDTQRLAEYFRDTALHFPIERLMENRNTPAQAHTESLLKKIIEGSAIIARPGFKYPTGQTKQGNAGRIFAEETGLPWVDSTAQSFWAYMLSPMYLQSNEALAEEGKNIQEDGWTAFDEGDIRKAAGDFAGGVLKLGSRGRIMLAGNYPSGSSERVVIGQFFREKDPFVELSKRKINGEVLPTAINYEIRPVGNDLSSIQLHVDSAIGESIVDFPNEESEFFPAVKRNPDNGTMSVIDTRILLDIIVSNYVRKRTGRYYRLSKRKSNQIAGENQ